LKHGSLTIACAVSALVACGGRGAADARDDAGPPGVALLFPDGADAIDAAARTSIFSQLGLAVDSAGTGLLDTVCGQPATAAADVLDLNADGTPEVRVVFGNTCTSGIAGSSVALFIERDGAYVMNLGFPAASADPMETSNEGWPDLLIGGPGFCWPVWRWNGTEYAYHRDEPQEPGGCSGR